MQNRPISLAVLVSGSGTNLQALLDAALDPGWGAQIVAVGADRDDIEGLARAARAGLPTFVERVADHAELSTAGVSAAFTDLNGDGCTYAGFGFGGVTSVTIGAPAVQPIPYGGGTSMAAAASLVFPGPGLTNDLGFVAVVPNDAPTVVTPTQSCTCTLAATGCLQ